MHSPIYPPIYSNASDESLLNSNSIFEFIGTQPGHPGSVFDIEGPVTSVSVSTSEVPEPVTLMLVGTGLVGLAVLRRAGSFSSLRDRHALDHSQCAPSAKLLHLTQVDTGRYEPVGERVAPR
jgi:PEP-CTERM motif-containing protein